MHAPTVPSTQAPWQAVAGPAAARQTPSDFAPTGLQEAAVAASAFAV